MSEQLFTNWSEDTPVREAIMQSLGGASVAWEPKPEGIFLPEWCSKIGDELEEFFQKKSIAQERPLLGLATTRQLIEELQARWTMSHTNDYPLWMPAALQNVEKLFQMDGSMDYRTVDSG